MEEIQKYSNILLKQDPYNEKLYYEIMDIYALNGNYNMAIKLYYDLEKILADELGVEPSSEVTELFHRIFNVKGNTNSDNAGLVIYGDNIKTKYEPFVKDGGLYISLDTISKTIDQGLSVR